jgi:hypothetical protein
MVLYEVMLLTEQIATHDEQLKIDKYAAQSTGQELSRTLLLGTVILACEDSSSFLQQVGHRIPAATEDSRAMTFLWQRCSVSSAEAHTAYCVERSTLRGPLFAE